MITAALVGVATPPMVQVTLTTDNGQAWSVIGTDGVEVWAVPGGSGVGDGQQVTLADNRKPGNREITYQVTSGSRVEQSQPIVIPFASGLVIQTLSGSVSIEADYAGSRLPLDFQSNQTRFDVPGRPRPVIRYAPTSDMASVLPFWYPVEATSKVRALLSSGEPLLVRCGEPLDDFPSVSVVTYGSVSTVAVAGHGMRRWELPITLIDDPYLEQRLGAFTWDYIDALQKVGSMVRRSGDVMEAIMAGRTWDEIDAFDWSVLA